MPLTLTCFKDDEGNCVCADGNVDLAGTCITSTIVAATIALLVGSFLVVVGYLFVQHKNRMNDLVWHVNESELRFDDPIEVIGEGAFGVVLLAEYRGTKVAIKRALKAGGKGDSAVGVTGTRSSLGHSSVRNGTNSMQMDTLDSSGSETPTNENSESNVDLENPRILMSGGNLGKGARKSGYFKSKTASVVMDLGFLAEKYGRRGGRRGKGTYNERFHEALTIGSGASSYNSKTLKATCCPWFDSDAKREAEFVAEMRLLSTLRHPCICTVMGAVVARNCVPMLVMGKFIGLVSKPASLCLIDGLRSA